MSEQHTIDAEARRRIMATVSHTAPFMQKPPPEPPPDPAALRARLRADQEAVRRDLGENGDLTQGLRGGRSGWGRAGQRGRARWLA